MNTLTRTTSCVTLAASDEVATSLVDAGRVDTPICHVSQLMRLTELADAPALPAAGLGIVYMRAGHLWFANSTTRYQLS